MKEIDRIVEKSDYIAGAHQLILQKLNETNLEVLSGYGADRYCESAREKIRKVCEDFCKAIC